MVVSQKNDSWLQFQFSEQSTKKTTSKNTQMLKMIRSSDGDSVIDIRTTRRPEPTERPLHFNKDPELRVGQIQGKQLFVDDTLTK